MSKLAKSIAEIKPWVNTTNKEYPPVKLVPTQVKIKPYPYRWQ